MKIILSFVVLLTVVSAYASCSSNHISVFPEGKIIRQKTIIMIEGYAQSQKIINQLGTTYPVYLKSGHTKVKLIVKETLTGQFQLTQAILEPESGLKIGVKYELVIDSLPKFEYLARWNPTNKKREPIIYEVIEGNDSEQPKFQSVPKETSKSLIHYGCGPEKHVNFSCFVSDSSEYLVKATVKNMTTSVSTSYYVRHTDSTVSVGHGMCSGAFRFNEDANYQVVFSLLDMAGNTTEWVGDPIPFTNPEESERKKPTISIDEE
ncbi:MAG: hypothetical protein HYZ43_03110 [Flavobacteriia bacterium]|nr:hypothetical protein [Flavobacteriia bacterium]